MFGSKTIKSILKNAYKGLDKKQKYNVFESWEELKTHNETGSSWLTPFLHQVDARQETDIYDGYAYQLIKNMIWNKDIFVSFLHVENWAYPNKSIERNLSNINTGEEFKIDADIKNDSQGSDGYIALKDNKIFLELVYNDEKLDSKKLKSLNINKGTTFSLEIGTTGIGKVLHYLKYYGCVARLPYETGFIHGGDPCIAFFYSKLNSESPRRILTLNYNK